jgi:hypothetical protein
MTPAQRNQARTFLTARAEAVTDPRAQDLLALARGWIADFGLAQLWWGACAWIVRAERVAGMQPITPDVRLQILALLEELRVAVGGTTSDPDFKDPSQP